MLTDSSKRPAKSSGSSGRLKACLHLRSFIAMTTTTKTAAVKTTKTTITKAELKKIKAAKKTAGKIAKSANGKKNALA